LKGKVLLRFRTNVAAFFPLFPRFVCVYVESERGKKAEKSIVSGDSFFIGKFGAVSEMESER
jgi:hypothetical protein